MAKEIDTADTLSEAERLEGQYLYQLVAYDDDWVIWVETQEYEDGELVDCG